MWKQKLGISLYNNYNIPTLDVIDIIANTKFDAVSPEWKEDVDLSKIVSYARDKGLIIQSLHAPYHKCADIWGEDEVKANIAISELLTVLDDCASLNIPILVCHVWIGFDYDVVPNEKGLKRYQRVVDKAKELNIKLAFENTEGEEFLFALMDYYKNEKIVGFCWDSGHELCYNHSQDLLKDLGDRLIMTHLNDNVGISRFDGKTYFMDDLHLLPYDGISDWRYNVDRLKNSAPLDIINFELSINSKPDRHENDLYMDMKLEVYFAEAYKRACKIAHAYIQK